MNQTFSQFNESKFDVQSMMKDDSQGVQKRYYIAGNVGMILLPDIWHISVIYTLKGEALKDLASQLGVAQNYDTIIRELYRLNRIHPNDRQVVAHKHFFKLMNTPNLKNYLIDNGIGFQSLVSNVCLVSRMIRSWQLIDQLDS